MFWIAWSKNPGVPLMACAIWGSANFPFNLVCNKPRLLGGIILLGVRIPAALASSDVLNNHPSLRPTAAKRSANLLLTVLVIAWEDVNKTDDFKLFSSPNNLLIAVGSSSPVLISFSSYKSLFAILCKTSNGSSPSTLQSLNIFLTRTLA